jgi:hypothetical protein
MNGIARYLPAIVLFALGLGCGDTQQAPSMEGPLFLTAMINGEPWSPDPLDAFAAVVGPDVVSLQAHRNLGDGGSEMLYILLVTSAPFRLGTYRLAGHTSFAQLILSSPANRLVFVTDAAHLGSFSITGANSTDSVVSGVFAFSGQDRSSGEVRQVQGRFRVRYEATGP